MLSIFSSGPGRQQHRCDLVREENGIADRSKPTQQERDARSIALNSWTLAPQRPAIFSFCGQKKKDTTRLVSSTQSGSGGGGDKFLSPSRTQERL